MFNLVFNVENEFNCLLFKPGALTFKQSVLFQIKIFINLFSTLILFSILIAAVCIILN